jgi:DNA (cytosine-5)-methyltransferase 1
LTPLESERLQGFPDFWTLPSETNRDIEEIDTLRYTAIGNAVSIPIIEWLAQRVYACLKGHIMDMSNETVREIIPEMKNSSWSSEDIQEINFSDETRSYKWPKGGIAVGNHYIGANINPTPKSIIPSILFDIIEKEHVDRRYYLTPNAAEGILRRVDRQGRTLFAPLRGALEREKSKKQ